MLQFQKKTVPSIHRVYVAQNYKCCKRYSTPAAAALNDPDVVQELKPWKEIPGPSSLPLIGQLHHFLPKGSLYGVQGQALMKMLQERYGPAVRMEGIFGRPPILYLFDPPSTAQIIRGENLLPRRPSFLSLEYYRSKEGRLGGLLASHGTEWKKVRSTVNPILLLSKTIELYKSSTDEVANDFIQRLKSKLDESGYIKDNLLSEMNLWALESIGVMALGGRLNCLDPNLPSNSSAHRLIQCVDDIFSSYDKLNFGVSLWRYYPTESFKKAMDVYKVQEIIAKSYIDKAIKEFSKAKKNEDEKGILQKLHEIDEEIANIMACDMLFAGIATSANTIVALMYLLATNPDKQEKLRQEIISKSGEKYLKACIKESMRIMPISSKTVRQTNKEYNVLGYRVPKDTMVLFGHQQMSMLENQYPRAHEYIPERWIVDKEDPLYHGQAEPLAFNPFGFGVRSCAGRRIAELEVETLLKKLIENFKIEWFGPHLKIKTYALNFVTPPYNFKLSLI